MSGISLSPTEKTVLSSSDLLRNLAQAEREAVLQVSRRQNTEPGDFLFHQGDPANYIYLILKGIVKLTQLTEDGQQINIRVLKPGETFAVLAVLQNKTYPVAAQAVTNNSLLLWDRSQLREFMRSYPRIQENALDLMATRIQEFQDRVRELATERVERRIARTLLRLTEHVGRKVEKGIFIDYPLSRQELAEMSGTTLYTVSRTLKNWEAMGIVEVGRASVTILYPHGLVIVAEDLPDRPQPPNLHS